MLEQQAKSIRIVIGGNLPQEGVGIWGAVWSFHT
jgi:hypothetical protein